jgi:hypothetical protein
MKSQTQNDNLRMLAGIVCPFLFFSAATYGQPNITANGPEINTDSASLETYMDRTEVSIRFRAPREIEFAAIETGNTYDKSETDDNPYNASGEYGDRESDTDNSMRPAALFARLKNTR